MTTPLLMVLAGPNGAGKTTLFERVLSPVIALEFVNADRIAAQRWPGDEVIHAYEAARIAAERRQELVEGRRSFVAETVFSHESKLDLMRDATRHGFVVELHVVLIPEHLAVERVKQRVSIGGHDVPEAKVRSRYRRLWGHVRAGIAIADEAKVYDNSSATAPLRLVASFQRGMVIGSPVWPDWVPAELFDPPSIP